METNKSNQNFVFNTFDLIRFAWDKKWILIILSAIALILSIIYSLNITPRYKSEVVIFPASAVSLSKNLLETYTIPMDNRDILTFGVDDDVERMMQVLHSNQIKDHIARKFDLMSHYRIDPASAYPKTQLEHIYKGNVKFRRTEYMSLEISVLDEDPQMAADIANEIAVYADSVIRNMQKLRAAEGLAIVEKEYLQTGEEVRLLGDSLHKIRRLGILDYESQASALNTAYANALAQGNRETGEQIMKKLNILAAYGGAYVELSKKLDGEMERLKMLKVKYASAKINANLTIPHVFIVDKAIRSERKAVPKRSVIVMVSTVSTFALALLLLLIMNNLKARS